MLDKHLDVMWNWVNENWSIWYFPDDFGAEPYHVTTVCGKGKSYRELGQDILLSIQQALTFRADPDKLLDYIEEHNNQIRRRREKDFKDKIRQISKETYNYVHGVLQVQVPRAQKVDEALK